MNKFKKIKENIEKLGIDLEKKNTLIKILENKCGILENKLKEKNEAARIMSDNDTHYKQKILNLS